MISPESAAAFVMASTLLALAPGPDNIFVLAQASLHGRWAGIVITLGLCSGLVFHTAAVALGVAAIIQSSALAFNMLKIVGVLYLLYLAWQSFRAVAGAIDLSSSPKLNAGKLYLRGLIMNITNPKVSIFFLAFLPQFVDPSKEAIAPQIFLFGLLFMATAFCVFGAIACLAGSIGGFMSRSIRAQKILNGVAGSVFVLLALKLVSIQQ